MSKYDDIFTAAGKAVDKPAHPHTTKTKRARGVATEAKKPQPGRPTGKRSDTENYVQITAYIERSVREDVDDALLKEKRRQGRRVELSIIINDLLRDWAKSRS